MGEEAKIERMTAAWAHRHGLHAWKLLWPPGAPDRVFFGKGRTGFHVVFIEFKAPSGRLAPKQEYWGRVLTELGARWYRIDNKEVAIRTLCDEFNMDPTAASS